ncbi:hypothetical protein niasHT_037865 [Heterodera trifolii]|uniref:Uncharacterized protein n=1 Tax=Heterodera trifolii TaxID=157864 RepID=A0ABD2ISQ1_9BILA
MTAIAACLEGVAGCRKALPKAVFGTTQELSRSCGTQNTCSLGTRRKGGLDVEPQLWGRKNNPWERTTFRQLGHLRGRTGRKLRYQRYFTAPWQSTRKDFTRNVVSNPLQKKVKGGRGALLLDDSRVIPYNPYLLLKYGCHVNIEYALRKHMCRLLSLAGVLLEGVGTTIDQVFDYDEIAATFKVRYMTAIGSFLRLNSYKIVGTSHQIYTLSVHDEGGQTIVVEEGHEEEGSWKVKDNTRLTAFFKLCGVDSDAAHLTYDRVPYHYSWNYKARAWKKRVRPLTEDPDKARMFVRVYTVSQRKHELFAIRGFGSV